MKNTDNIPGEEVAEASLTSERDVPYLPGARSHAVAMAQMGNMTEAGGDGHGRSTWSTSGPLRHWTHLLREAMAAVDVLGGTGKRSCLETLGLASGDTFQITHLKSTYPSPWGCLRSEVPQASANS